MPEPEKKKNRKWAGVFSVLVLCLAALQWAIEPTAE